MPMKTSTKKYANRKGAGKPKRAYKKRVYRTKRTSNISEYASLSVKRTLAGNGATGNFNINSLYSLMNTQLVDYQRAVQVAQAYQHYKIRKITVTIKPTYDTFANGNQSKMHLYFMIDKSGSVPTNVTLEGLKQMGARPFALDEKERKISWSPSVLQSTMYQPGVGNDAASQYKISPWLSTRANVVAPGVFQASGIDHLGLYWYCEQLVAGGAVTEYQVEVEVQFQFKKPLTANITGSTEAVKATIAVLDDSPDGVVGGAN